MTSALVWRRSTACLSSAASAKRSRSAERAVAEVQAEAQRQSEAQDGAKVRLGGETRYQADSWPHPRRVIMKAEILPKGPNTRFVVTSWEDDPTALYNWDHRSRGE